jgi:sugar phosphate isomerase/epimerase
MRISCSSLFLWNYHTNEIIEILSRAGIDSIEFWPETPEFWMHRHEPDAIKQLKETISTLTDHCTVHVPILDLNASSYNEYVCKATIMETLWAIDLSSILYVRTNDVDPITAIKEASQRLVEVYEEFKTVIIKETDK